MPPILYERCRCPKCKCKLDEVEERTEECPGCGGVLEPEKVWETRSYPGVLILPPWIRAFGWPVLLILVGVGFFVASYAAGEVNLYIPGFCVATGLIYFFVKLSGADRRY